MTIPLLSRLFAGALMAGAAFCGPALAQRLDETDMLRFLVQAQCVDAAGRPTAATPIDPQCQRRSAQTADDRPSYRKHDWGDVRSSGVLAYGYQATDAVLTVPPRRAGGPVTVAHTFDFGSANGEGFGVFSSPAGDGGDVMVVENGLASIFMTEDGGGGLQWFVGDGCRTRRATPDRAWLLFGDDARYGAWSDSVARLLITRNRNECPASFSNAYTRWTRADVALPFRRAGAPAGMVTVDTIVSEHYDLPSIAQSGHLERFFFGRDLGKVRWERWEHPQAPDPVILQRAQELAASGRCPHVGYSDAPGPGWYMVDCRMWTNLLPAPSGWSPRGFAWSGLTAAAR